MKLGLNNVPLEANPYLCLLIYYLQLYQRNGSVNFWCGSDTSAT
jgi:hypothetical protein